MKYPCFIFLLISSLIISGCVSENNNANQNTQNAPPITTNMNYVTDVTPFDTIIQTKNARNSITPATFAPEDLECVIYSNKQSYAYDKKAFTFNVKNPPIIIKYSVADYPLITRTKIDPNTGGTITFQTVDPSSFFEVIVRDKSTDEIYLEDGFSREYGYHDGSIKLNKMGDLLFELNGNKITADVTIWAKPIGNIDDTSNFDYSTCVHWV